MNIDGFVELVASVPGVIETRDAGRSRREPCTVEITFRRSHDPERAISANIGGSWDGMKHLEIAQIEIKGQEEGAA